MQRREFLKGPAASFALGQPTLSQAGSASNRIDTTDFWVIEFIDDDWDPEELEENLEDALDLVCYAYGEVEDLGDTEPDQEPGYLDRIGTLAWESVRSNPEAYDWILEYGDRLFDFIESVDLIPEWILDDVETVANKLSAAERVTKFIPLVWSVKGLLDTGCQIYEVLESGRSPDPDKYVRLFKNIALILVEIVLIASGIGAAYKVAFRTTGAVNRLLINIVGRRLGWGAYSWLLSMIHWGIRVVFASGVGQAMDGATERVAKELVAASPLSQGEATQLAQNDVRKVAKHSYTNGFYRDPDYLVWKVLNGRIRLFS